MAGRRFLQVPGPSNVPDRIRQAMDRPVIDHRGSELPAVTAEIVERMRGVFGTSSAEVVIFPGSGTAGWEASIVNTLSLGDRVLAFDLGQFSHMYAACARAFGMEVDLVDIEWGRSVPIDVLEEALAADTEKKIRVVQIVHNETSTGVTSSVADARAALDRADHPALLFVDAVSSVGSMDFQFDRWGVDVAVTGAQKGLMLPPGMTVLGLSQRAIDAGATATSPRFFLDWRPAIDMIHTGYFPYTPATLLLYGLRESLRMLDEEGLPQVYARHARLAAGTRAAVAEWELETVCCEPAAHSTTLTAVWTPEGVDADEVLRIADKQFQLSLGGGLMRLKGRAFRIGHLGWLNELELLATISGTEMSLHEAGVPVRLGSGVGACERALVEPALVAG
jgi:alanine-glyoxylate transaminase / serine-glyoxylate transaminase / serine-pyruvate transaminase